jgi:hypothetical protein
MKRRKATAVYIEIQGTVWRTNVPLRARNNHWHEQVDRCIRPIATEETTLVGKNLKFTYKQSVLYFSVRPGNLWVDFDGSMVQRV